MDGQARSARRVAWVGGVELGERCGGDGYWTNLTCSLSSVKCSASWPLPAIPASSSSAPDAMWACGSRRTASTKRGLEPRPSLSRRRYVGMRCGGHRSSAALTPSDRPASEPGGACSRPSVMTALRPKAAVRKTACHAARIGRIHHTVSMSECTSRALTLGRMCSAHPVRCRSALDLACGADQLRVVAESAIGCARAEDAKRLRAHHSLRAHGSGLCCCLWRRFGRRLPHRRLRHRRLRHRRL